MRIKKTAKSNFDNTTTAYGSCNVQTSCLAAWLLGCLGARDARAFNRLHFAFTNPGFEQALRFWLLRIQGQGEKQKPQ